MPMDTVISLRGVHKRYGRTVALDGVDLDVPRGSIFGFLGPNGAGKTTTLRILIGLLRATDGRSTVLGLDPWRDRVRLHECIGYLPGGMGFYEGMTGRDLLDFVAALMHGAGRRSPLRAEALDALALADDVLERPIRSYSRGMRQKLAVVQALQHDPELLLLDEPSEGLDPLVQHSFADLLRTRRDAGQTIFFSSHTLSEVQALCDHVAIIREGSIVASSGYAQLLSRHPRIVRIVRPVGGEQSLSTLGAQWRIVERNSGAFTLHVTGSATDIVRALATIDFEDVTVEHPSLEDVFLEFYEAPGDRPTPNGISERSEVTP